jgi:CRP/FNR family transcriptional regulator, cyclic AMP receptor protein
MEDKYLDTKYWYLRDHKFFWNINATQLKSICLIVKFINAKKQETIYFTADDGSRVYFLKKGTIKIVEVDSEGNEIIKDVLQKGDLFGQFDSDNRSEEFAIATSDCAICSFLLEDFENMIQDHPSVALKYTKWLGFKFKRLENRYANLMYKDVPQRLLLFLKEWAAKEGELQNGQWVMKNYLTHQDLASLICAKRQTVTQFLNLFKEKGLIDYSRSFITIIDLDRPY